MVNISSCLIIISLQKFSPCLTHFLPMFHFYNPWKNKKSEGFIDVFRDYRSGRAVENGFMILCTLLLLYSLNTFSSFCLFCLLLLNKVVRVHTWVSFWSKFSVWWKWLKNFTCVSRISLNLSYFQKFLNLTRETLTLSWRSERMVLVSTEGCPNFTIWVLTNLLAPVYEHALSLLKPKI